MMDPVPFVPQEGNERRCEHHARPKGIFLAEKNAQEPRDDLEPYQRPIGVFLDPLARLLVPDTLLQPPQTVPYLHTCDRRDT